MKYKEWLNDWLNNYIKPTAKEKTITIYNEIINQHIVPYFGDYELDNFSAIEIQKYVTHLLLHGNKRTGQGLSSNSVNSIITVIQSSLKTAYDLDICRTYTLNKIKRPKLEEKQVICFTIQEQKKIEKAVIYHKKDKMLGVLICLYSGLRIGELLALEWTDIDLIKGEISVNKCCHDGRNKNGEFDRIIDKPKTQSSIRIIPIPKQLLPYIREMKKNNKSEFVISSKKQISVRSYQNSFSLLLKKLGISHKGFHALRHTFATRALECGMDVKTLSEILGHKNPAVTLNRYVHSIMEHKKEMMNKLGKLL